MMVINLFESQVRVRRFRVVPTVFRDVISAMSVPAFQRGNARRASDETLVPRMQSARRFFDGAPCRIDKFRATPPRWIIGCGRIPVTFE